MVRMDLKHEEATDSHQERVVWVDHIFSTTRHVWFYESEDDSVAITFKPDPWGYGEKEEIATQAILDHKGFNSWKRLKQVASYKP